MKYEPKTTKEIDFEVWWNEKTTTDKDKKDYVLFKQKQLRKTAWSFVIILFLFYLLVLVSLVTISYQRNNKQLINIRDSFITSTCQNEEGVRTWFQTKDSLFIICEAENSKIKNLLITSNNEKLK